MFKYTKEAIELVIEDIKKYSRIFKYGSLIFTTAYFIYALLSQTGNFIVNITLTSLFICYTIFDFATHKNKSHTARRIVKRTYKWIRLGINAFTLGAMIYGIYTATTNVSPISIIFATLMIILWVIQIFLELVIEIIENKVDMLKNALTQDVEDIKKPFTAVGNVFKKLKGEEIKPAPKKSKGILRIEQRLKEKHEKKKSENKLKAFFSKNKK